MFKSKEEYERFKKQYEAMNRFSDSLIEKRGKEYYNIHDSNGMGISENKNKGYSSLSEFLEFWQELYDIFKNRNHLVDLSNLQEKIKVRKLLNEKFGIKN